MKLCRFQIAGQPSVHVGLVCEDTFVADLDAAGITSLASLMESDDLLPRLTALSTASLPRHRLDAIRLLAPIERQEVWAAGVTYLRSKTARMEESDFSATAYDRVYDAPRPEIFYKASPEKVVGAGDTVGIRGDSRWNVPEPELALVINSRRQIVGFTAGNDMSSRDIEGANLLYLPQAKIYDRSCALGPFIRVGVTEQEVRQWSISIAIERAGQRVFAGQTGIANLKRSFDELTEYLFRSQSFPHGAVLLTGTGVVPPGEFTLQPGDAIHIAVSGIGTLTNSVVEV